jgi:hypothetical protein
MLDAFALHCALEARTPVDALVGGDVLHSYTNVAIRL